MAHIVRWLCVVVVVCGRVYCQDKSVTTDTELSDSDGARMPKLIKDKLSGAQLSFPDGLRRLWWPSPQVNLSITEEKEIVKGENVNLVKSQIFSDLSSDTGTGNDGKFPKDSNAHDGLVPLQLVNEALSVPFRGNHVSAKSTMVGATSRKMDPSCLRHRSCRNDTWNIDFQRLEIHFWDLPERSAEACAGGCLALIPSTQLVFAKMIAMNERLVCGCGNPDAITGQEGVLDDAFFCSPCPDGEHKCGGVVSVSVYSIVRACRPTPAPATGVDAMSTTERRAVPHGLSYAGCFRDGDVLASTAVVFLKSPKRSVTACADYCRDQPEETDLVLVSYRETQDRLICSCGRREMSLASAPRLDDSRCQTVCPDGGDVCGGPDAVSVYGSSPILKISPFLLLLPILLLLTPSADAADTLSLFR